MLAIPVDNHTQHRRPRLAVFSGKLVKPFDVFIGQIGENASHNDILISYHDIMSSLVPNIARAEGEGAARFHIVHKLVPYIFTQLPGAKCTRHGEK